MYALRTYITLFMEFLTVPNNFHYSRPTISLFVYLSFLNFYFPELAYEPLINIDSKKEV